MRNLLLAAALLGATASVPVYAQEAPKYSTSATAIKDLMADPEAKAVLEKHMPQIAQAAGMVGDQTLKALQGMAPDRIPDSLLATIDADLANIK